MSNIKKIKSGFSLLDFLIVFIVLGCTSTVVFKVFSNYQDESKNNVVKKESIQEYSYRALWDGEFQKLSQATSMLLLNNNGSFENLCSNTTPNKCMMEQYVSVLSIMTACPDNVKGKCWHNTGEWFLNNMTPSNENVDSAAGLILNNGVFILFNNVDTTCSTGTCGQIYIDVNGFAKPNREGNDIFKVDILKNSLSRENM